MHELSLVQQIFSSLEEALTEDEMERVTEVELQVGELTNVEPILLQNAFSAYQMSNPEYAQVALTPIRVPITISCQACGKESRVEGYKFRCAHCGQPSREIVTGEELLIHKIHMKGKINPHPTP